MDDKRFYGIYRGVCVDNQDPNNINRIKLQVPQILNTNVTNWAYPCTPVTDITTHDPHIDTVSSTSTTVSTFGGHTHNVTLNSVHSRHASYPNVGQGVWVMFEGGDPNFPVWIGVY